jgi:uncharacterized protein with von Willebrand factor type A (vWA) domain
MIDHNTRVQQAVEAKSFMESPVFKGAVEQVRRDVTELLIASEPESKEAAQAHRLLHALQAVIGELDSRILAGRQSHKILEEETEQQEEELQQKNSTGRALRIPVE